MITSNDERTLDLLEIRVDLLETGNAIRARLPGAILGSRKDVLSCKWRSPLARRVPGPTGQRDRDRRFLNRTRLLPAFLEDAHEQIAFQAEILEFIAFRIRDILQSA